MRHLVLLPALLLGACSTDPDLSGDWFGDMECGSGSPRLVWSIDLAEGAEARTFEGASELSFDTTDGEYVISFGLELRVPETEDVNPTLDMDVVDCTDNVNGSFNCWSANGVWDTGDDELNGTFEGVPVNDGTCDFSLERGA